MNTEIMNYVAKKVAAKYGMVILPSAPTADLDHEDEQSYEERLDKWYAERAPQRAPEPMRPEYLLSPQESVRAAQLIATIAHRDQADKAGKPYIEHPRRVVGYCRAGLRYTALPLIHRLEIETVAWLHDVVEDTSVTVEDLIGYGFSPAVTEAVRAITRLGHEPSEIYYARVAANDVARFVKYADLADNSNEARLALLDPETAERLRWKYKRGRELLDRGAF